MLTEERYAQILRILQEKKAVTVTELTACLHTSESTIRRDLNALHEQGKLNKVHGGATLLTNSFTMQEEDVQTKARLHIKEKERIARYAASIVNDHDFIYIDAGTTTEKMIDFLQKTRATFVTNGVAHAKKLIQKGFKAYIIGGQLKLSTEAVVGAEAVINLKKMNFTKAFLGANGISDDHGVTTPDVEEGLIKAEAVNRSYITYVLADSSKFGKISSVTFADLSQVCIVTDSVPDTKYHDKAVIKEV
ncbi:MAG: DeoR/GlpR family DNA-binding transcription regulator [Acutalibacteraceae bacterium]|nr:DeoR/GlpR family DNA-binding transcription regulator [Acutalibacteraceae bacterium]HIR02587.1 DeoR/GlpR transcriptional regulator [Candidatus Scatovicinus merdipullorum]